MNSAIMGERVCRTAAVVIVIALLISAINLPRSDGQLRESIESLKNSEGLQPGEKLPEIIVPMVLPRPGSVGIPPPGKDVLVMFYSGKCPLCRDAWPTWNTIAEAAARLRDVEVLAISVLDEESTRKDLAALGCRTAVGLFAHTAAAQAYKIRRLPAILYLRDRTVVSAWYGRIGHDQQFEILQRIAAGR